MARSATRFVLQVEDGLAECLPNPDMGSEWRESDVVAAGSAQVGLGGASSRASRRTMCRFAGLRVIGCYVLRHAFASHLVMRGVAIRAVQDLMGHASIVITVLIAA